MKKTTKIKAVLLSMLMLFGIIAPTTVSAQRSDGFFRNYNDNYENRTEGISINDEGGIGHYGIGETVPLTSGLLIFTAIGAGYAMAKRRRNKGVKAIKGLKGINAIKGVKGIKVAAFQKKFFLLFLLFLRENLLILRLEKLIP